MNMMSIRQHPHSGVYTDGSDLYTRSLLGDAPGAGRTVAGENGNRYRPFPPGTTKLSAIVKIGARLWPFTDTARVLYLGAGAGTTVSYMSDVCPAGQIIAVEFAPEPFRSLVEVARERPNVVPILADARDPSAYAAQVGGPVDVIYQDVAQRDQWDIALRNARRFLGPGGCVVLVLKARSVDVASPSARVFDRVRVAIEASGFIVREFLDLAPFDKEHGVFMVTAGGGP